jgi:hypothetical protein
MVDRSWAAGSMARAKRPRASEEGARIEPFVDLVENNFQL